MTREDAEATVFSAARYVMFTYVNALCEPIFKRGASARLAADAVSRVYEIRDALWAALSNIHTHENYRQLLDALVTHRFQRWRDGTAIDWHENALNVFRPYIRRIMDAQESER